MTKKSDEMKNTNEIPERPAPVGQSYEPFRPNVILDNVTAYLEKFQDPNYNYKGVIINYKGANLARNVLDHEAQGYEIVYTTHQFTDSRAFAPDAQKRDSSVPSPVLKNTSDGYTYLLMRVHKDKARENDLKRSKAFQEHYLRSVKSIKRQKSGDIHINGGFINDNNGDN